MMDMHGFETGVRAEQFVRDFEKLGTQKVGSFRRPKLDRWLIY
jgi:hypothetical protein